MPLRAEGGEEKL